MPTMLPARKGIDSPLSSGGDGILIDKLLQHLREPTANSSSAAGGSGWMAAQMNTAIGTIRELSEDDAPSSLAVSRAVALLAETEHILSRTIAISQIESFEGDIILHWNTPRRGIALVCPAGTDRATKLYREELAGNEAVKSKLQANPSARDLASAIEWIRTNY